MHLRVVCCLIVSIFGVARAGYLNGGTLLTTSYGVGIGSNGNSGGGSQNSGQNQQQQQQQQGYNGAVVNSFRYAPVAPVATSSTYRQQITNSVPATVTYSGLASTQPQYFTGASGGFGYGGGQGGYGAGQGGFGAGQGGFGAGQGGYGQNNGYYGNYGY